MRILVLGGAGYIGSHTVYELIARGDEVIVVDNLETGHREAVHKDAIFYEGDIRDRAFVDFVFEKEKVDAVIHFAANSLVGESMEKRSFLWRRCSNGQVVPMDYVLYRCVTLMHAALMKPVALGRHMCQKLI